MNEQTITELRQLAAQIPLTLDSRGVMVKLEVLNAHTDEAPFVVKVAGRFVQFESASDAFTWASALLLILSERRPA